MLNRKVRGSTGWKRRPATAALSPGNGLAWKYVMSLSCESNTLRRAGETENRRPK